MEIIVGVAYSLVLWIHDTRDIARRIVGISYRIRRSCHWSLRLTRESREGIIGECESIGTISTIATTIGIVSASYETTERIIAIGLLGHSSDSSPSGDSPRSEAIHRVIGTLDGVTIGIGSRREIR